ncbi:hypothetical protein ARMGADRAFT_1041012 [Armillaria gallica]|uniref:RING-type domain-containing protein n=1 Tax=Armillaria gallica TaxID=47427 RepID=A0A2H3CB82_ARMGA|nr:hypothetical protein ARMGADRAFT_1041012 [Armillaria gallica]
MSKQGSGRHYCRADGKAGTFALAAVRHAVALSLGRVDSNVLVNPSGHRRWEIDCLTVDLGPTSISTSRQLQHARLEMFTPPTPAHATSSRALQNERGRLEMSSDSSRPFTPAPSTETLFGDFRVLEQECKKLEKRAVRAEGKVRKTEESLNRMTLMYCQAQSKTQNTEESFNQLMHMHRRHELDDARNGDWYFWDFVKELRCGICNKDLDGAYSLACGDTFHGTCLWQWFEETVHEHMVDTALGEVEPKGEPRPILTCPVCLLDVREGPIYNYKVVNLIQMLGGEEGQPGSYDWEVFFPSLSS